MISRARRACRMPPDERRAAIVAASLPIVLQHGLGASTRQIAEAAGVAEGTIFRVFPDKDALMRAVLARACDPEPTLREMAAVDRAQPLSDRLVAGVQIMEDRLSGLFGLFDALGLVGPPPKEQSEDGTCRPSTPGSMNDAFRDAVIELVGPDEYRLRVPAGELAHVLQLLVFSNTHPLISGGRQLTARGIVTILLDGLLDRSGHPGRCHHGDGDRTC